MVAVQGDQLFEGIAEPLVVGSDKPFRLHGGSAWYIRSGGVNVFSVPVSDGKLAGARSHLFRVGPDRLLLGVTDDAHDSSVELIAVGGTDTKIIELSRSALLGLAGTPEASPFVCSLLDQWIDTVYESMEGAERPETCQDVSPGEYGREELSEPEEKKKKRSKLEEKSDEPELFQVRPGKGTLWFRIEGDGGLIFGRDEVNRSDGSFPLASKAWLQIAADSRIFVEPTAQILDRADLWTGLDQLHGLLLERIKERRSQASQLERERLRRRAAADRRAMGAACKQLAGTLAGEPMDAAVEIARSSDQHEDALLAACKILGKHLDIAIRTATQPGQRGPKGNPLVAIARSNAFRTRQVLLREGWWREPGWPLLAYIKDSKRPVALVPTGQSQYVLHDPIAMTQAPVNRESAENLEPVAHCFYRSFGDQAVHFLQLLKFGLRNSGRDLTNIFIMGAAAGLLGLLVPIVTGVLFNDIIPGAERGQLVQLTLVLVVIAFATAMFNISSAIAMVRLDTKLSTSILSAVWDRLLRLPLSFFRPYTAGDLANRAMSAESIRQVLSGNVATSVIQGVFSLFQLGLMFYYSTTLGWWALLVLLFAFSVTLLIGRLQMTPERAVAAVRSKLAGTVLQFLSSIAKLRVAGAEIQAFAVWASRFSEQRREQLKSRTITNWLTIFTSGYSLICQIVIYILAVPLLTEQHTLRVGDFLAFMTAFNICLGGVLAATQVIISSAVVIPLYEHARPILAALPEVDAVKADPGPLAGDIEVQHLFFRYSEDGPEILRDVSLRINAGEFVALVGPSGSGKSTILRMLLGFDDPESGNIYYDGQEFAGLDRLAVRSQIGVVLQGGRLMAGDVFTNIVGSSQATMDDAWEAARMAGLDHDIRAMPMGMHTVISEGGGTFSGGQRQRLMIARAIVNRPKMLFFDEATSALDNRTQAIVSNSLDRMRSSRLIVAHRLSTIERADRIYVLVKGLVADVGTYDELMSREGPFYELAKRQIA